MEMEQYRLVSDSSFCDGIVRNKSYREKEPNTRRIQFMNRSSILIGLVARVVIPLQALFAEQVWKKNLKERRDLYYLCCAGQQKVYNDDFEENTSHIHHNTNNCSSGQCDVAYVQPSFSFSRALLSMAVLFQIANSAWVGDITLDTFESGTEGQKILGASAGDKTGWSVSGGDINGDGFRDVIIGSPNDDLNGNNAGAAHVLFGHDAPFNTVDLATFSPNASIGYMYRGDVAGGAFGTDVTMLGDMNGDGIKDYALVCPLCSSPGHTQNGKVYVIYGRPYNATYIQYDINNYPSGSGGFQIVGDNDFDSIGTAIASAGDFNSDGRADLLVSSPTKDTHGVVYVLFGQTSANTLGIDLSPAQFVAGASTGFRIHGGGTTAVYSNVGQSVAAAGDVNGDGFDDIVIGAPATSYGGRTNCGAALVIFGRVFNSSFGDINLSATEMGLINTLGFAIIGAAANDKLGFSVSSMKNMNGDIYADLILGAPNVNGAFGATSMGGSVWVYYGRPVAINVDLSSLNALGAVFYGAPDYSALGTAVAGVGDINGDGFDDFAMSAPSEHVSGLLYVGVLYVIYGKSAAFTTPQLLNNFESGADGFRVIGPSEAAYLGMSVSGASDINNDGLKDIVVGAHGAHTNGRTGAGITYVLFGVNTSVLSEPPVDLDPTRRPSRAPTLRPTRDPTTSPEPSIYPTDPPNASPTTDPTTDPTADPNC